MHDEKEFTQSFDWGIWKRLKPFLKNYRADFVGMLTFNGLCALVDVLLPLMQRYAIRNFIEKGVTTGLLPYALVYLALIVLQGLSVMWFCNNSMRIEMYLGRDMKQRLFHHLQTLSFSFYNVTPVGYLLSRVMSDTNRIAGMIAWNFTDILWALFYVAGTMVSMLILNWKLALVVMLIVPVMAVLTAYFQNRILHWNRRVRKLNSRITGAFNEGITGAKTTKTLVIEDKIEQEFDDLTGEMKRLSVRAMHFRGVFMSTTAFAASIALAIVLWRGGVITRDGVILIGTLSVFMNYAQGMMEPIQWLVQVMSSLVNVQVNVERVTRLLETESDVSDTPEVTEKYGDAFHPKKENWEPLHGDIEFQDVTFRYPDGSENVLEHFNLKIPQGTNVAIVGETGAGKSTLVNLVCRFFEPTQGRILIDGRDARERSQLWLHSNIGYVLQTPHLFSGTVLENLRYGRPDATMDEIEAAVKAVSADQIIARLPDGYNTDIGEGGNTLSTGEKQLLSFARALLADPRIFVLDEATSSVDTVTERLIQDAIEKVMAGRTSFIIAHRLSTIRRADVILVVHDGKIIESGTHRSLMEAKGAYYQLYTRQYREEQTRSMME